MAAAWGRPQSPALRAVQAALRVHGDLTLREIMGHARVTMGSHMHQLNCREARHALSNGLRATPPVFVKNGLEKRAHAKRWCVLYGLAAGAPDLLSEPQAAAALGTAMQAFWGGHAR
jgi:hypothetical protein